MLDRYLNPKKTQLPDTLKQIELFTSADTYDQIYLFTRHFTPDGLCLKNTRVQLKLVTRYFKPDTLFEPDGIAYQILKTR